MDPQPEKSPGLALPQPSVERGGIFAGASQSAYGSPEVASATPEMAPGPTAPIVAVAPLQATPQAVPQMPIQSTDAQQSSLPGGSTASDDTDALDEEWVNKAKAIVERTKEDPYIESKELSKAKADYLNVRYNKQIKVVEDHQQ